MNTTASSQRIRILCWIAMMGATNIAAGRLWALPLVFEPLGSDFAASAQDGSFRIGRDSLTLSRPASEPLSLHWIKTQTGVLAGEEPTGGYSNYFQGSDPKLWRRNVRHYRRVRASDLYAGIAVDYYDRQGRLEFDLLVQPEANVSQARFEFFGKLHLKRESSGDLVVMDGEVPYRFRRPNAYQVHAGIRETVECSYILDKDGKVGFQIGSYDPAEALVIDPVIEYLTYLGGSGPDRIQLLATDSGGNPIVAGITHSVMFPGTGPRPAGSESIFVSRLNASGSAVLYTTILGTLPNASVQYEDQRLSAIAVDADDSVFLIGTAMEPDFPITPGAWQQTYSGGFVIKLDGAGQIKYSTWLGPVSWGLQGERLQVRNGVAYIGGEVSRPEFLGTPGALQRNMAGPSDLFLLALSPDGASPVFATAFGGSGIESLYGLTLNQDGSFSLLAASTSQDLPLTSDALPVAPSASQEGALIRIDSTGGRLLYSSWLGLNPDSNLAVTPDGGLLFGGHGSVPTGVLGSPPLVVGGPGTAQAYIAKWSLNQKRFVWATQLSNFNDVPLIACGRDGSVYFTGPPPMLSGGSFSSFSPSGLSKLSSDGSHLLYGTRFTATYASLAFGIGDAVWVAGTSSYGLPSGTAGALQPSQSTPGSDTGFIMRLDLSSFRDTNFFIPIPLSQFGLTWRIGEPLPQPLTIPISFGGDPVPVEASVDASLSAIVSAGASPVVSINVNPALATSPGKSTPTLILNSPVLANSDISVPLSLTVQPQVSFQLAQNQIQFNYRSGQARPTAKVGITTHFGSEAFDFTTSSSQPTWLYAYASGGSFGSNSAELEISLGDLPPGTYNGTVTVKLVGLQNAQQTIAVQYIVTPAATISLSTTVVNLHVVKTQPIPTATIDISSSVPGVAVTNFVGVSRTWLKVTLTSPTTPAKILVTVDGSAVELGSFSFSFSVGGEGGQQIQGVINVDVSSGAPLDVTPASIDYTFTRNGPSPYQAQLISLTSPSPAVVQLSADQTWITTLPTSSTTPFSEQLLFNAALPEGVYHGNVMARLGTAAVTVPITFRLYDAPHIVISSKAPLDFKYQIGGPVPAVQSIALTSPTLQPAYFNAGIPYSQSPFIVNPTYGSTPATLNVSVDPTGLAPGTYKSNLSIFGIAPSLSSNDSIPVTLEVAPDPNIAAASISSVTNAASFLGGGISPGEILVLFGSGIGPATLVSSNPSASGQFPKSLTAFDYTFDGVPAPVIYASSGQAAIVAPFGLSGKTQTNLVVEVGGKPSSPLSISVVDAAPAIFTADATGTGNAASLNIAPDGSVTTNNSNSPGKQGGIVTLFATGLGATSPLLTDGSLPGAPLPALNESVQVLVGGQPAEILYSGPAPGLIAGLMQLNILIPKQARSGSQPLLVVVGNNASQPGVTLAIQ